MKNRNTFFRETLQRFLPGNGPFVQPARQALTRQEAFPWTRAGIWHEIQKAVANGLFPKKCVCCGVFTDGQGDVRYPGENYLEKPPENLENEPPEKFFSAIMGPWLCGACRSGFIPIRSPGCPRCGRSFASKTGGDHLCGECMERPGALEKPFSRARACGSYTGVLKKMIHAYKYHGKTGLGRPFGELLHFFFRMYFSGDGIDRVVPVPLHRKKLVKRGFDQVTHMLESRAWPRDLVAGNLLVRVRHTETQTGLDRRRRGENVKNAFAATDASAVSGRRILLIDDVFTTGATLEECARTLNRAGASGVFLLTLARAM